MGWIFFTVLVAWTEMPVAATGATLHQSQRAVPLQVEKLPVEERGTRHLPSPAPAEGPRFLPAPGKQIRLPET